MFTVRRRSGTTAPVEAPQDVENFTRLIASLADVRDAEDGYRRLVENFIAMGGFGYGAAWCPDESGQFRLVVEAGELAGRIRVPAGGTDPLVSRVGSTGAGVLTDDLTELRDSPRAADARAAGMQSGTVYTSSIDGRVAAVLEFYCGRPLALAAGRVEKLAALQQIADLALSRAVHAAQLREIADDRAAVTTVVSEMAKADDQHSAARTALDTVRSAFGWAYGSYWRLDPDTGVLRFDVESGSAGDEFRQVTLAATFAEGVGLSGRAWRSRDLVFVQDLAELTDCVRAPAAGRAGVRSGVCFPIMDGDRVVGTMDFFTTERISLSESRASALRNVQQLVSQRLALLRRTAEDARNAGALLESVAQLHATSQDAARVAAEAVARAAATTDQVENLGSASTAIGDVIRLISGIADQTNLLALNATIEAARAGEVGRGFAVVASEVKELARETADATGQVSDQVAQIQATSRSVAADIHATSDIIGRMDSVQLRIGEILETQAAMARTFEGR